MTQARVTGYAGQAQERLMEIGHKAFLVVPDHLVRRVDCHYHKVRGLMKSGRFFTTGAAFYCKDEDEHGLALHLDLFSGPAFSRAHMWMPEEVAAISDLPTEGLLALAGVMAVEAFRDAYVDLWGAVKARRAELLWLMPDHLILIGLVKLGGLHFRREVRTRKRWIGTVSSHFRAHEELAVVGFCPVRTFGRICRVIRENGKVEFGPERVVDSMTGEGYRGGQIWSVYAPSAS